MVVKPIADISEVCHAFIAHTPSVEELVALAAEKDSPELLAYIPNIDPEKYTYKDFEISTHIFYANARRLLRMPVCGLVDYRPKYCSVYSSKNDLKRFLQRSGIDLVTMRFVSELVNLYQLTQDDLRLMSTTCCEFELEETHQDIRTDLLAHPYTPKQFARLLPALLSMGPPITIPAYCQKGTKPLLLGESIHIFRGAGIDPFQALIAISMKDEAGLKSCKRISPDINAFSTEPISSLLPDPLCDDDLSSASMANGDANAQNRILSASERCQTADVSEPAVGAKIAHTPSDAEISTEERHSIPGRTNYTALATPIIAHGDTEDIFSSRIQKVTAQLGCPQPETLPRNLHVLRSEPLYSASYIVHGFDALLLASNPSNLDLFNYFCLVSRVYHISLSSLFTSRIAPMQYRSSVGFTLSEYHLDDIATALDLRTCTDETLFELLGEKISQNGPSILDPFGFHSQAHEHLPHSESKTYESITHSTPCTSAALSNATESDSPPTARSMKVDVQLRICMPCDTDSWENDNPDPTSPGFRWEPGDSAICKQAADKLLSADIDNLTPGSIRTRIAEVVNRPFRANVCIVDKGIRLSIELR